MLSLGGAAGTNGWWSVFIMCVCEEAGMTGHRAVDTVIQQPSLLQRWGQIGAAIWGAAGFSTPTGMHEKWVFVLSVFFPPFSFLLSESPEEAQHVAEPQASVLPPLSFSFSFSPSLAFSHSSLLLLGLQTPSLRLSIFATFLLHLLIFSPPPRGLSLRTSGIPFFFFFSEKQDPSAQTQFKLCCPLCCLLLKLPALWIPVPLKWMPSAFLLHSHS